MEEVRNFVVNLFAVDSIWSVVFRGVIWAAVAVVILATLDQPKAERSVKRLKSNLGFFLLILILSGVLIYLLFGYAATPTAAYIPL